MGTREPVPDMFRFCVYCDADCYDADGDALPKDEVEHRPDCPIVTGLYHVQPEDHGPEATGHEPRPGFLRTEHRGQLGPANDAAAEHGQGIAEPGEDQGKEHQPGRRPAIGGQG